jgi:3-phenylpropionate/cinnamic acid dioxygenase small subunit
MSLTTKPIAELHFEVQQFLVDYQHILNERRYDDWYSLFALDASYSVINIENLNDQGMFLLRDDGSEALKERVAWIKGYWQIPPTRVFRTLSNLRIGGETATGIDCWSSFVAYRTTHDGVTELLVCGQYHDVLTRTYAGLRIATHDVILENGVLPTGAFDIF